MTWYIGDLARYRSERNGLGVLAQEVDWLTLVGWRVDTDTRLIADAEILVGDRKYPIFVQFPEHFPFTPPSVFPRGETGRWSEHQFGAGGELCLEYGPDTWTPDLTAVHLVRSAHKLLEGENPAVGERGAVPSRHQTSVGTRLRGKYSRLLLTRETEEVLTNVPVAVPLNCNVVSARHKESHVNVLQSIDFSDGTKWSDAGIPSQFVEEFYERAAPLLRLPTDAPLPPHSSFSAFKAACAAYGLAVEDRFAILLRGVEVHAYLLWKDDDTAYKISVIAAQPALQRLDAGHSALAAKSVALIGCGSLGGKIATSLARCGVGRFLLIDDDILFPDNLVRNDLDWRDVGTHKAEALQRRLQLVSPAVETRVWRAQIGGQEANQSADAALALMAACDLVVDATASPTVLNLVSAVVAATKKTVIWGEVMGGGVGGIIARCRPDKEPPPQYMRRAIENWFAERGQAQGPPADPYAITRDELPMIADDADVTAIAAHTTRMTVDALIGREPSLFPHSVYAIGLGKGSIFSQPFETFPIEVGNSAVGKSAIPLSAEDVSKQVATIVELYKALANETAPPDLDRNEAKA